MRRLLLWGFAAGCAGDKATPTETLTDCEGAGDPVLELGTGGQLNFAPFSDGDTIEVRQDGSGRYGLYIDLSTAGIDTTATVTALLRFSIGSDPATTDVGATLTLQCTEEGRGWFGSFATLDDALQDEASVAGLDGQALHLTGILTDQSGESAEDEVELVLEAP